MSLYCGDVIAPTTDNDPLDCDMYISTNCVMYESPISYFGFMDPSTATEVFDAVIASLMDTRTRLVVLEGGAAEFIHADLQGLDSDDHTMYLTKGRAFASTLTGYAVGSNTPLATTDTLMESLQNIQGQLNAITSGVATQTYIFEQPTPAITWVVEHNLNKYPSVTIVDSANTVIEASYTFVGPNLIHINLTSTSSGKVYLN